MKEGKQGRKMRSRATIAIVLLGLGIVVLAYSGISFRTRGRPVHIGPVHLETTRSHFVPPVVGAILLVGGIALLVTAKKRE